MRRGVGRSRFRYWREEMTRTGRVSGYGVGMTDRKGVDSIGRGRGSDGERGGAELRRERRRCCAAVVLLVVRTEAGRGRRRAAGRRGGSSECGKGCAEDPVGVAGGEEERRGADCADRSREPSIAARSGLL